MGEFTSAILRWLKLSLRFFGDSRRGGGKSFRNNTEFLKMARPYCKPTTTDWFGLPSGNVGVNGRYQPGPSPEVEFCLRGNSRFRAGLGICGLFPQAKLKRASPR